MTALAFDDVARLAAPGDNVAIAARRLEAGTRLRRAVADFALDYTVMEGHRFAVAAIGRGEPLLSWGLPFGTALADIVPGQYVCNEGMLEALGGRRIDFALPASANFADRIEPYRLDPSAFRAGTQVGQTPGTRTFLGYHRGSRGVGTRNYAVVLGTASRTAAYARALAARLQEEAGALANVDGVVAVAHTEGGGRQRPNNEEFLLRCLAGFCTHPNVGAVLAVDYGTEAVPNARLRSYLEAAGYPTAGLVHEFLSIDGGFDATVVRGEQILRRWLPQLNAAERTECGVEHLKIALQCGGSDAFSGISGNPLAAWVAREVIGCGGSANLAETDELIGAEPHVLANVRDLATAQRFLDTIQRFVDRVARYGVSAEGNPSGGNKYRGLYNIALKSIGAAMKRHPEVRLDQVIDYGEPMAGPGYYFMDSPGNDLESIAGQVASGCNLIFFVTGNGSVTNFPFVPTVKILTTTARFELLSRDMDVNAGAYQDGTPMEELGRDTFELALAVASGQRSRGEEAGHSQVSVWRDWPDVEVPARAGAAPPSGRPLPVPAAEAPPVHFTALARDGGHALDRVGLVMPTSLCSAQIARLAAERLTARAIGRDAGVKRFVALAHTEGCGVSGGPSEDLYTRILLGYLVHPLAHAVLLLEHGCEKTHNDYMRVHLREMGVEADRYGWASVQMDGGIEAVLQRVEDWFEGRLARQGPPALREVGLEALRLGLLSAGPLASGSAAALALLARWVVTAGGTVVVSQGGLSEDGGFARALAGDGAVLEPTLAHGQTADAAGLHVMEQTGEHWTEALTGLGAAGVEVMVGHVGEHPIQGHPLVPLLQVTAEPAVLDRYGADVDVALGAPGNAAAEEMAGAWARQLLERVVEVAARQYRPHLATSGNTDFQITRGPLGVSL